MRTLSSSVQSAMNANSIIPVSLFEVGGSSTLRFTNLDTTVRWDGKDWLPKGISYSQNKETLGLDQASYEIVIENYEEGVTAWLLAGSPIGKTTTVYEGVTTGAVDMADRILLVSDEAWQEFYGRNTSFNIGLEFSITVKTWFDMHQAKAPGREQVHLCRFRGKNGFKGTNCGYSGPETSCNYTYTRCNQLGNVVRFGGFPDLDDRLNR
jgi:phage-related protein